MPQDVISSLMQHWIEKVFCRIIQICLKVHIFSNHCQHLSVLKTSAERVGFLSGALACRHSPVISADHQVGEPVCEEADCVNEREAAGKHLCGCAVEGEGRAAVLRCAPLTFSSAILRAAPSLRPCPFFLAAALTTMEEGERRAQAKSSAVAVNMGAMVHTTKASVQISV